MLGFRVKIVEVSLRLGLERGGVGVITSSRAFFFFFFFCFP